MFHMIHDLICYSYNLFKVLNVVFVSNRMEKFLVKNSFSSLLLRFRPAVFFKCFLVFPDLILMFLV